MGPQQEGAGLALPTTEGQQGPTVFDADSIVRLSITGSRNGGAVEQIDTYFNAQGQAVSGTTLLPLDGILPIDLSGVATGTQPLPSFPGSAYTAAMNAGDVAQAKEILAVHTQALTASESASTVEEGLINAGLQYAWDVGGYANVDDPERFVITRQDVILKRQSQNFNGSPRTLFTVSMASKFGG